jgi:hypothetical protein
VKVLKKKKTTVTIIRRGKTKSYIIFQTKICEKEKKNEQLKATHWSPALGYEIKEK